MERMKSGIHHVTGITANVQANVDFYVGFLGLKLVKRTGGFADAEQLHLLYGDGLGSPGSLLTFLVWEAAGRGRTGTGQVSEVALAVPPATIGDWLTRALSAGIPLEGPVREFAEPVLRLKDPDGMILKLVGVDMATPAAIAGAPTRLRGVTLLTDNAEQSTAFIARFGYRYQQRNGLTQRLVSDTDVVDVREVSGFVPTVQGPGVPDHVAFRARDGADLRSMRLSLGNHRPTEVHDRKYFLSLYVRDPANILIEHATDGPGLTVDEAPEDLGRTLFLPPHELHRQEDLRVMLPQFALPGEGRFPVRDLPFTHRWHRPESHDGSTILLLHGTGGNEADLMPIAHRSAPRAALLGVRGRSSEEGSNRWFRRFGALAFDQADIRREAEAFEAFVEGAIAGYGIDANTLTFVAYSNGANFLAAFMQLHPGIVRRAVLLRGLQVLEGAPKVELSGTRVLVLNGRNDPFAVQAPALQDAVQAGGAEVAFRDLEAGHDLTEADTTEMASWLRQNLAALR
jgi:phospholipase/carboxylesterase